MVSINLGFINLLPIPLLDGGHLLFYVVEGVRRKPLRPEAQEWAFRTGLAVLLALMIFVTFNDLASFGLFGEAWRLDRLSHDRAGRTVTGSEAGRWTRPFNRRRERVTANRSISERPRIVLCAAARHDHLGGLAAPAHGADAPRRPRSRAPARRRRAAAVAAAADPDRPLARGGRQPAARAGDGALLHLAAHRRALRPTSGSTRRCATSTRPNCSPTSSSPAPTPATSSSRSARIR